MSETRPLYWSKEWQVAIDSIPKIITSSHHLIDLSFRNKEILDGKKWKSEPRSLEYSPKSESFKTMYPEASKGPNGEDLSIHIYYPDEVSNNPNYLQVYGDSVDGYFSYTKSSREGKPEELEIGFDQGQWRIRIMLDRSENTLPNACLYYRTTADGDLLLMQLKDLRFDKQGNINLIKDRARIDTILHFPYTSIWRENTQETEVIQLLEETDKQRTEELKGNPNFKKQLEKRIGFAIPDNYAQVQQDRINSLPYKLNWFEGLNTLNGRIQNTITLFESLFKT